MKIDFEYGHGTMAAELPDNTDVFVPGETVPDPPAIAESEIVEKTRKAIENPIGMKSIPELVGPESKVTIIFPDRVKGGSHETAHRKVSIPILIEECVKAGVKKENLKFICSNGLHRKNRKDEIHTILGDDLFNEYWWTGQIVNHDSEDWDNLVDLGEDELGDHVIMTREVFESDLAIAVGHTLGNPYGGYSGGYKHVATGITHWRTIAAHHVPHVMHRDDFTPVSSHSLMRKKFDAIGRHMEKKMGRKFFLCDGVLDTKGRQIAVFAGYGEELQPASWEIADKRTYVPWAEKKYDVMVFGMPQSFHYGNGHGTNPILILQAIAANVIRHRRIMSDRCVIICSSTCNGWFHDEVFTGYRELYDVFQKDYHQTLPDVERHGEYFTENEEFIKRYRFDYGFHPYHCFSMVSCGQIAEDHCAAVYLVGAQEPGYARGMGMKTRATFEEALEDAKKKYVGPNPNILALPRTFKTAGVHLMMKE
jgi:nickel-dependent lactate racemase